MLGYGFENSSIRKSKNLICSPMHELTESFSKVDQTLSLKIMLRTLAVRPADDGVLITMTIFRHRFLGAFDFECNSQLRRARR